MESIIVTIIILAMIFGANGIVVSQSSGDVSVTRLVNGSSTGTAQYLPGDNFTVQLDYVVAGTQYAISIEETLQTGWSIVDSNMNYSHDSATNTYTWNISSLLSGVSSGTILYLVKIPDGASLSPPSYAIDGSSEWYSSLSDVADGHISGSAATLPSNIKIGSEENNGPCIWIPTPSEEIGDGDGHIENGEFVAFRFVINDSDGIQSYRFDVNDADCNNITIDMNLSGYYIAGTVHAKMAMNVADANDLENTFKVYATDNAGISSELSSSIFVPNYDYTIWTTEEWNGWTAQSACFEPGSSINSGWIVLQGGNPINLPILESHYLGPKNINGAAIIQISSIPFLGGIGISGFTGDAKVTVDAIPRTDLSVPLTTHPIYSENGEDVASAVFYGTPEMSYYQKFHVALVNMSGINGNIGPEDIENAISSTDMLTDGSCDIHISWKEDFTGEGCIPELYGLKEGYYALVILDYRLPNTPCLVAVAPIVVTKCDLTADKIDPALPMPGDSILYNLNMAGAPTPGAEYMYFSAMVPEKNYSAAFNVTSDGSVNGTTTTMDGFTVKENIGVKSDGTKAGTLITVTGVNGTYTFTPDELKDIKRLENMLISELGASNVSVTNTSLTTATSNVEIVLNTKPTMPAGRYVVLSWALENGTDYVAAFNQTYVDLGTTYDIPLYAGWNLVSLPIKPIDDSLTSVFAPDVLQNVFVIWGYNSSNASPWDYYVTAGYPYIQGNLSEFNERLGYWVLCYNNTTLRVTGTIMDTSNVTLNAGWNLVGNPTLDVRNVRNIYTNSFVVWEFDGLTQKYNYWCSAADVPGSIYIQGSLNTLKPGYGYWVLET